MAKRKPAAVLGALVNMKNVATHKSVALTIHVPAEAAQEVLAAFGWPTMVDPVPVAVARLEESASAAKQSPNPFPNELAQGVAGWDETSAEATRQAMIHKRLRDEQNVYPPAPYPPVEARLRHWADLSPAEQTGVIRNEPDFWAFVGAHDAVEARDRIRHRCGVESCADIRPGTEAAGKWAELQVRYGNWLRQRRGAA